MTASKAIEYLQFLLKEHPRIEHADFGTAIKLGREALIFYQTHKSRVIPPYTLLLPGEDPE